MPALKFGRGGRRFSGKDDFPGENFGGFLGFHSLLLSYSNVEDDKNDRHEGGGVKIARKGRFWDHLDEEGMLNLGCNIKYNRNIQLTFVRGSAPSKTALSCLPCAIDCQID